MKKFIWSLLILIIITCLGISVCAASKSGTANENEIIQIMKILKIMEGDHEGNLKLDNLVTRAEFSKILVQTSGYKDDIKNISLSTSLFPDLRNTHWASGYVYLATQKGYIKGYLDGSFRPENHVTLEEAVTMVLRLLGYSENDLTGVYPHAQLSKYEALELNDRITAKQGERLTRKQCMMLIYNTLCADSKSGQSYCQTLGYTADANGNIDLSPILSQNTSGPFVITESNLSNYVPFPVENSVVYKDSEISENKEINLYDVIYYSKELNTIWSYRDKVFGVLESVSPSLESPSSVVVSGKQYSLSSSKIKNKFSVFGTFKEDDILMLLLDRNGNVCDGFLGTDELYQKYKQDDENYFDILDSTVEGPVVVHDILKYENEIPLDMLNAKIYCNTKEITKSDIQINDVIYYSEFFNSVWVYRTTVTGLINNISPNKESPQSVTLQGKNYTLDTVSAKYKLSSSGIYDKNDFVTLLLGRNDTVADVINGSLSSQNADKDEISYSELVNSTLKGPYTVMSTDFYSDIPGIDFETALIYKNHNNISLNNISANDILYYSETLNSVWVYSKKETGILEDILPNASSPEKIMVSGNLYTLETSRAKLKVSSIGTYQKGDTVCVLIGRAGDCADIVSVGNNSEPIIGIVTNFKTDALFTDKNGITYKSNVATVCDLDGVTHGLQTNAVFVDTGKIVRCTLNKDKYIIEEVIANYSKKAISSLQHALDSYKFSDDCKILDISGGLHKVVYPQELYGMVLENNDVLYYDYDNDGNIAHLALDDYTGDLHSYGYIRQTDLTGFKYTYLYVINGEYKTYTTNIYAPVGGACIKLNGDKVSEIIELTKIKNAVIENNYLKSENSEEAYPIHSNVQVYVVENGDLVLSKLSEVVNKGYRLDGYADGRVTSCGKIRVIIAN